MSPAKSQASRTGLKWKAPEVAKLQLRQHAEALVALVGTVKCGRAGLGCSTKPCYGKAKGKDRNATIQEEL